MIRQPVLDLFFLEAKKVKQQPEFLNMYANHLKKSFNLKVLLKRTTPLFNKCRVIINTFWWSCWNLDVIPAYSSTSTCYKAMIAGTVARKMKQDISWNDWWIPEVDSRQFLLTHSLETRTFWQTSYHFVSVPDVPHPLRVERTHLVFQNVPTGILK